MTMFEELKAIEKTPGDLADKVSELIGQGEPKNGENIIEMAYIELSDEAEQPPLFDVNETRRFNNVSKICTNA